MAKSKLTLIVDGNWLLMSRLVVLNNRYADDVSLVQELKLLLVKSMNLVLKTFPSIDNIMFVTDGGSWRNQLEVPSFLQKDDITYKGNREKDETINWDMIFQGFQDLQDDLIESGINCYHESGVEGDDWAWYWSQKLNSEGTNCIIWTKDRDLTQLVHTDADGYFTAWWNKDNGVIVEDVNDNDMNFLFNAVYNENESLLQEIIDHSIKITKINPNHVIIDKIIRGDAGDNILPIIKKKSATSTKEFRVGTKDIDLNLNIYDTIAVKHYITELLNKKSYIGKVQKPIDEILEHFAYNVRLVVLKRSSYPNNILEVLDRYKNYNKSCDTSIVESKLSAEKNSLTNILDIF